MPDILIRGMEMPKHCIDCPCMVDKYGGDNCCLQSEESNEKITSWDDMKAGCPLIELPEHGDLIDKSELLDNSKVNGMYPHWIDTMDVKRALVIVPSNKEETE